MPRGCANQDCVRARSSSVGICERSHRSRGAQSSERKRINATKSVADLWLKIDRGLCLSKHTHTLTPDTGSLLGIVLIAVLCTHYHSLVQHTHTQARPRHAHVCMYINSCTSSCGSLLPNPCEHVHTDIRLCARSKREQQQRHSFESCLCCSKKHLLWTFYATSIWCGRPYQNHLRGQHCIVSKHGARLRPMWATL